MNEESDLCVLRYLVSLAAAMQIIIDVFWKNESLTKYFDDLWAYWQDGSLFWKAFSLGKNKLQS